MIKEIRIFKVDDFNELYNNSWSGALSRLNTIRENNKEDEFLQLLNDILVGYEEGLTDTELNDFIWFDDDDYMQELGIDYE